MNVDEDVEVPPDIPLRDYEREASMIRIPDVCPDEQKDMVTEMGGRNGRA